MTDAASELENAPATWNGRMATTIALALGEFHDGNPHRSQHLLREALEEYIATSGTELGDHLATIARLPRVENIREEPHQ